MKKIDIKEFRKMGYLQEVNRRFLHPLGLALEIEITDNGEEIISGVLDCREDPEGIIYNLKESSEERKEKFKNNKKFIDSELNKYSKTRKEKFGFDVEDV